MLQRCKLAGGRRNIVFGQGNPNARLMFVGEAPGAEEDAQGLAFVGRAGHLLTDIIEKGLKIPRADVFTNARADSETVGITVAASIAVISTGVLARRCSTPM